MTAFRSVSSCSPNQQRALFGSVLLSGGTGSSPSLRARMQRELSALVSPTTKVKVGPPVPCGAGLSGSL
ncbi:Actin-1 [Myotis brandtii]|uniref:Actin-1 n=1 Tax=Myotis brandtii TaxID=109478 RepID=S7P6B9_MYOBR|nr:Actin-1 [Myotis brandtii]